MACSLNRLAPSTALTRSSLYPFFCIRNSFVITILAVAVVHYLDYLMHRLDAPSCNCTPSNLVTYLHVKLISREAYHRFDLGHSNFAKQYVLHSTEWSMTWLYTETRPWCIVSHKEVVLEIESR